MKPELMPTLRVGAKSEAVCTLAARLHALGFWNVGTLPGTFSRKLEIAVRDFQATALGPDKEPLVVDGIVGFKSWWALANYSTDEQRLGFSGTAGDATLFDFIPAGITELRRRVVREHIKLVEAKVAEDPRGSNRGRVIDDFILPQWWVTKYGDRRPLKKGPAWCQFTYTACYKAGVGRYLMGRNQGSTHGFARLAKKHDRWAVASGDVVPPGVYAGDCALILNDGGTGHAACIFRISEDGRTLNTIEGNVNHRVAIRVRKASEFVGYVRADHVYCNLMEMGLLPDSLVSNRKVSTTR